MTNIVYLYNHIYATPNRHRTSPGWIWTSRRRPRVHWCASIIYPYIYIYVYNKI